MVNTVLPLLLIVVMEPLLLKNSILNTNGKGSPCVYSTGTISVSDSKGTATNSACVVIEGKNSITLNNNKTLSSLMV